MYRLWRKFVIFIFIILGLFFIVFGITLLFDSDPEENPLKYIIGGGILIISALAALRFKNIWVR